jgi:hypothetical protein
MTFSMKRSRLTKMSSSAGFTSQAMKPSQEETTRARPPPRRSHGRYGRR